jgi:signal transduction histidine kinase
LPQQVEPALSNDYAVALGAYVVGGAEEALLSAPSLGRQMLDCGLPALLTLHGEALKDALPDRDGGRDHRCAIDRATRFLIEASAPFELSREALGRANVELQSADAVKNRFLAHISHELRTPLNSILGFSDLLLSGSSGGLDARQTRYVTHIHGAGKHLLNLVNDILDLSKIRAGLLELSIEAVAVAPVADRLAAQIRPLAENKRIAIGVDVDADLQARADTHRLEQVLLNLLSNALKFTPDGGSIWIRAWRTDGQAAIAVSDTGVGIPAQEQTRVFEEFTQLEQDGLASRQGTGLGLAVARRLVDLMEGRLTLESEVGRGSTFTVLLPAAVPARP